MRPVRGSAGTEFLRPVLLAVVLVLSILPFTVFPQDVKPGVTVLPFQQDALQPVNNEALAIQYYQNREYGKAADIFEQLNEQKPSQYYFQYLIISLVEAGEYSRAEKLVKRSMRSEPGALRYQVDLGYINFREGNTEKSRKLYEDALKSLRPDQQQIFDLANAFLMRGENEYAIRTYQAGRKLLNYSYPFGFELASVYERTGDFKNAMEEYLSLLDVNKSYLPTVQDRIQMTLAYDVNNEKNEAIRKILLSRAQKNPDKTCYAELLWWYSIQQRDFDLALIQAKSLDRRLGENGEKVASLAGLAVSNEKYDVAIDCYRYLVAKGESCPYFETSRRDLVNTRYIKAVATPAPSMKSMEEIAVDITKELQNSGENADNVTLMRNLAYVKAFYLEKPDEAADLLYKAIDMPGVPGQERAKCKIELADILLFTDDVWQATLLYQQAYQDFKYDILGQEAKFRNAKLSFYIGEFKWAQAQADVLKAATSKFISNDAIELSLLISENYDPDSNTVALGLYARADLLDYRNAEEAALVTLDSIPVLFADHPILQHVLFKKGQIRTKQGKFAEADTLFAQLIRQYPDGIIADEALMQRAGLNEKALGNNARAMELYMDLLGKYPGSIYIPDARRRYRALRGDNQSP